MASVTSGSTKLTVGQVNFCDASATHCTDIHLLGTAQLTSAGTAVLRFYPGIGSHSYKAVFVGTPNGTTAYAGSTSSITMLSVTGTYPTGTVIAQAGNPGNYTLTATVASVVNGSNISAPTGTVSFLDTAVNNTVLATASLGPATTSFSLLNSSTPTLKQEANAVAVADFNGDGIPDLAVSDSNSGQVLLAILLGNGDGTFTATPTSPTVGLYPDSIAVGDFNGDGMPDLAVTSVDQNTVTILLGNGDGTFRSAPNLSTGSTPQSVATGDFNGDGVADLVVVNAGSVLIFLGNGDGSFKPPTSAPTGASSITVAIGDFNGDGIPDLAVTNSCGNSNPCNNSNGTVSILIGKGDGTFAAAPASPVTGPSPVGLATADFNGDGILDLAVSNNDGENVNDAIDIFLGNGDGTFKTAAMNAGNGLSFKSIAVADFNGDGIPDLAVGEFWHGQLAIYLGKGDGTFSANLAESAASQLGSGYIVAADFNGDGIPDLVAPSQDGNVPILLAQPTQAVTATASGVSPTGPGPHQAVASYPGDSNYSSSISATIPLIVQVATPIISPAGGSYTSVQTISATDATPGATIYYEAVGTVQTSGLVLYTGPITVSGEGDASFQFYATATGYQPSSYRPAFYSLNLPPAIKPVISLASGVYPNAQTVTMTDATPNTTIYYTTNGTAPTTSSAQYTGPITISSSEALVASAIAYGYSMSAPASAQYAISSSSSSFIYTVAGNGTAGYNGDGGPATSADLNYVPGTALDSAGNLYIADGNNNVIRKVAAGTGIITTVAGNGTAGYSGDGGAATSAQLSSTAGLALDSAGNLYISDAYDGVIRRVSASTGIITTYAGNGTSAYTGDNGPATSAGLGDPEGIAVDAYGNLYIAEPSFGRVRKIAASTGTITTVAGNGQSGYAGDGGPATSATLSVPIGVGVDTAGDLYIADMENNVIRRVDANSGVISTVAGNNQRGYSGDGGPATNAQLYSPQGVTVDIAGNLYIADTFNMVIRKLTASSGMITTVAGNGNGQPCVSYGGDGGPATSAALCYPQAVVVDNKGNLYIADTLENRIREVTVTSLPPTPTTAAPTLTVSAGTYASAQTVTITDATPGAAIYVTMDGTSSTTVSPGYNGPINVSGGVTINAIAVAPGYLPSTSASAAYTITSPSPVISTIAGDGVYGFTDVGGPGISIQIGSPTGVAFDQIGNFYFSDIGNNVVWKLSANTGDLSIVAGNGTAGYAGNGGLAGSAELSVPQGIAVDSAGNLYIADSGNNVVRKVVASTGLITTVAGNRLSGIPGRTGDGGAATSAELNNPNGLALDNAGNLYIADTGDNAVRFVSASSGIITTIAGNGSINFSGDGGPATNASLFEPNALALDSGGNVYVATTAGGRIRKIAADTGIITTVAGNGNSYGNSGDGGLATNAEIDPAGLTLDSSGNLYISSLPSAVRKVTPSTGIITTVAGNGYIGYSGDGGSATIAEVANPRGISFDALGNLYIADSSNSRVRKVALPAAATPVFSVVAGNYPNNQTVTISDSTQGSTIYYTTDGTAPTPSSSVYSGAITVSSSETIEAIAIGSGYSTSAVAAAAYTINIPIAATPMFSPAAGTYTSAQTVTISDATVGATIHYTTDGSAPTAASPAYTGPITISSSETIEAIAMGSGYSTSAVATSAYTINIPTNPTPLLGRLSPAFTSEGNGAFTLTVTGSGFTSGSTVYWGTTALSTQFGSSTQLTAQVPASDIASAGISGIAVQGPIPGGGTSNSLEFEVDSATAGSITPPAFTTPTANVTRGSAATYPVTLPPTSTNVSATCLNLPGGATCSYSAASGAVTILTSSGTPPGMYQITVVFAETEPGAATAVLLVPILTLPLIFVRRRVAPTRIRSTVYLGALFLAATLMTACAGGGSGSTPNPPNPTHAITSSGVVSLTIQ